MDDSIKITNEKNSDNENENEINDSKREVKVEYNMNNSNNDDELYDLEFNESNHQNFGENNFNENKEDINELTDKQNISNTGSKLDDEDKISKISKTSSSSLFKDLEEKWNMIEREKKKTRANSRHEIEDSKGSKKIIKNKLNLKNAIKQKFSQYDFYSVAEKYYKKTLQNRNKFGSTQDFDNFIQAKSRELEKFKKSPKINFENKNNEDDFNFNKNLKSKIEQTFSSDEPFKSSNQIICSSNNIKLKGTSADETKTRPSFLKPDLMTNNKKVNLYYRGNNFNYRNNANDGSIDNLVYESGADENEASERLNLNPSKTLISKMQNIFSEITQSPNLYPMDTENQSKRIMEDSSYVNTMNKINNKCEKTNTSINILDKTCSLKNLENNFDDIFRKFSPHRKNVRNNNDFLKIINLNTNKEKSKEISEYLDNDNFRANPKIQNLLNKKNFAEEGKNNNSGREKIFLKIENDTQLLRNLFVDKKFKKRDEPVVTVVTSKNKYADKVCGKNDFDNLRTKISKNNSIKVSKMLNLNN